MGIHKHESLITAIVIGAGFALVATWFSLLTMEERREAARERVAPESCRICGVVEQVGEVGVPGSGAPHSRIYETLVRHDDGTFRALHDAGVPQWKPGDRVKVIKGRVEPDASQTGRTATPGPQAARGW